MLDSNPVEDSVVLVNNVPVVQFWFNVNKPALKSRGLGVLVKYSKNNTYAEPTQRILVVKLPIKEAIHIQQTFQNMKVIDIICHNSILIRIKRVSGSDHNFNTIELSEFDNETNTCLLTLT